MIKKVIQQGREWLRVSRRGQPLFDARSVLPVREPDKMARTPPCLSHPERWPICFQHSPSRHRPIPPLSIFPCSCQRVQTFPGLPGAKRNTGAEKSEEFCDNFQLPNGHVSENEGFPRAYICGTTLDLLHNNRNELRNLFPCY